MIIMDGISVYTFSIVHSERNGLCIEANRGLSGRSFIEPVYGGNLAELYELWRSGDGEGINPRLNRMRLVGDDGCITDNGLKLVEFLMDNSNPVLAGLQTKLEEIDDRYRTPLPDSTTIPDSSELDGNHDSGTGSEIIGMGDAYPESRLSACEQRTLEKLRELEEIIDVNSVGYLAAKIAGVKYASGEVVKKVKDVLLELQIDGYVEGEHKLVFIKGKYDSRLVYNTTDLGKRYLDGEADQGGTGGDVQQTGVHDSPGEEEPHMDSTVIEPRSDDTDSWGKLYSDILEEFKNRDDDALLKLYIEGAKFPVLYTSLDKREGYPGSVYVKIGENAYCVGDVDKSNKLVISPEGMYTILVKGNVDDIRNLNTRKFFKVFDGLSGAFRNMMGNDMSGVATQLKDGTYRNIRELVSGKGNLKSDDEGDGGLFVAALKDLFERESIYLRHGEADIKIVPDYDDIKKYFDVSTGEGDRQGSEDDTSEYVPKYDPDGSRRKKGGKDRNKEKKYYKNPPNKR